MFLPVLKSVLSRFPAPCLNFQEKWQDTCVILKLQGQPKKQKTNTLCKPGFAMFYAYFSLL